MKYPSNLTANLPAFTPKKIAHLDILLTSTENVPMNDSYSSKLAGVVLPDVDGQKVQLGSLWANQSAVLVFLRHWG
ncbi:MAG TPA: hypothetical protein VI685_26030 [Candidatus Angelobacter sp.]